MTPKEEEVFFQVHTGLPREGPGSRQSTHKAFSCIKGLPKNPRILDIGCGPGAQAIQLAEFSGGEIYALDNHPPFIERLKTTMEQKMLESRVFPLLGDMRQLSFEPEFFDLIWAEGSIYIIGVEKGLTRWRPFLGNQGFVVFTEVSWLRNDPPQELKDFWKEAYPAIGSRQQNENIVQRAGYTLLHHFILPESERKSSSTGATPPITDTSSTSHGRLMHEPASISMERTLCAAPSSLRIVGNSQKKQIRKELRNTIACTSTTRRSLCFVENRAGDAHERMQAP